MTTLALIELLTKVVAQNASDLHLSTGNHPLMRLDGDLQRLTETTVSADDMRLYIDQIKQWSGNVPEQGQLDWDFALEVAGLSRFRGNLFCHRSGWALNFRAIAHEPPTLAQLKAPRILTQLALLPRGLVLITGPAGSGKTTTLAAMINHISQSTRKHIITIEEPVEFVHPNSGCLIHQRQVGTDTLDYESALRAALREDPDVIVVGELRDIESIRLAISAAETGHLVMATLHTSGAARAVDRLVDVFPGHEKSLIRTLLADSLQAVISQILCPRMQGPGRLCAQEILVCTPAIRNLIRENKAPQIYSAMQTGASHGMQTLDQSLMELVKKGEVSAEVARSLGHSSL